MTTAQRAIAACTAAIFAFSAVAPSTAHATEISATGKGIAGGALLGGGLVTITEGLIGVRGAGWYILGALVGAGGGGVGGYFLEQKSASTGLPPTNGRAQNYMLAGGLALLIPAIVLSLNANRYQTQEGAKEDNAPPAEPGADAAKSAARERRKAPPGRREMTSSDVAGLGNRGQARAPQPPSLVNVGNGHLNLGVPVPEVTPVFSAEDQLKYGLKQQTEVKVPVVNFRF
jgi:hypothetical protein